MSWKIWLSIIIVSVVVVITALVIIAPNTPWLPAENGNAWYIAPYAIGV